VTLSVTRTVGFDSTGVAPRGNHDGALQRRAGSAFRAGLDRRRSVLNQLETIIGAPVGG
jgi:hypothetical protein